MLRVLVAVVVAHVVAAHPVVVRIVAVCRISHVVAVVMVGHVCGYIGLIVCHHDYRRTPVDVRIIAPVPW